MGLPELAPAWSSEVCISCGVHWAMPLVYTNHRRETHEPFYCPNGHGQCYQKSEKDKEIAVKAAEIERLKRQLEWKENSLRSANAMVDTAHRSNAALKGMITKERKRVGNGVCPCCNRTFKQLAAHMACKHPAWEDEEAANTP